MLGKILVNRWFHTAILLSFLSGIVFVRLQDYAWSQSLHYLAFDTYNRLYPRAATNDAVIVDIDEASLGRPELGQWPWSRSVIAQLVDNLHAMGARAVAFDIVFAEADRTSPGALEKQLPADAHYDDVRGLLQKLPDHDTTLAQSIAAAGNVVSAFIWTDKSETTMRAPRQSKPFIIRKGVDFPALVKNVKMMEAVATSLPALEQASAGNGGFGVMPERDGLIRRVPLLFSYKNPKNGQEILYPSLATEALRVGEDARRAMTIQPNPQGGAFTPPLALTIGRHSVPFDRDGLFYVYFSKERHDRYIPAWSIIDGSADPALVRDKIVFVGTSAQGLKDIRSTPLDLAVPGVELHVNVAEQIMSGKFLTRPRLMEGAELISIIMLGSFILMAAPFVGAVLLTGITLLLIGVIGFLSWYGFVHAGLLLDPIYPGLSLIVLLITSALLNYVRAESERRRVREAFGLYISPDFMEELTRDPDKLRLGGETRELTVMFTDIRNFTTIAESMDPQELINLMNQFLTPMSDLVMSNRGTIDKYMGDAIMAFWNAPLDDQDHARHACLAALQMNRALDPINEELRARAAPGKKPPTLLKSGIGVNTGFASVGNMGSRQRFAYSAIGDTVNLASRLESQTKIYGASVLIGSNTYAHIPDFAALEADLLQVKGKTEPVHIYALLGDEKYAAQDFFAPWKQAHNSMLAAYRALALDDAAHFLAEARRHANGRIQDFYNLYEERIADLKLNPPGPGWKGVFVAEEK